MFPVRSIDYTYIYDVSLAAAPYGRRHRRRAEPCACRHPSIRSAMAPAARTPLCAARMHGAAIRMHPFPHARFRRGEPLAARSLGYFCVLTALRGPFAADRQPFYAAAVEAQAGAEQAPRVKAARCARPRPRPRPRCRHRITIACACPRPRP